jgi:hypothetical protein
MAIAGTRDVNFDEEMMPNGMFAREKGEFFGICSQEAIVMKKGRVVDDESMSKCEKHHERG